ncbi:fused MFS/spermidine synthase [Zoogloea sp.]|uniref:fused MFS/spermidine synthase n=1 Tax=Zoogloea sp. TaxID=49181 RepID=UPI001D986614|nr:fused MFS/spermidine synthase [Zoogloea sp.]MBK6656083.1 fused MFS/spermidine synthase [Zoogloea sp.]
MPAVPAAETPNVLVLPSPFFSDGDTIRLLEPADCDTRAVLGQVVSGAYDKPFIIDDGTTRSLHFSLSLIQSTMSLKDPFALELDYTQAMMSFLLFLPKPRNILMLGLGGGSLAKFCYRNVGSARITVVEIDPRVIAFRDQFELPPDDERLQVREGDGADAVIESGGWGERPDVIVMDAFDRHGISGSVNSRYFYQTVHDALAGRGVMVANLAGERLDRAAHLAMIAEVFDDRVLTMSLADGNDIVLAIRAPGFAPRWREIGNQAKALRQRTGLDFPKFAERLERSRRLRYA